MLGTPLSTNGIKVLGIALIRTGMFRAATVFESMGFMGATSSNMAKEFTLLKEVLKA